MRGIHRWPAKRSVTRSFDVFFDLRLNKPLSKQSWGWWFVTPSRSLWRHCNVHFRWGPASDHSLDLDDKILRYLYTPRVCLDDNLPHSGSYDLRLCRGTSLTHWDQDKIAVISEMTFSNTFSWGNMYESRSRFHWSLFLVYTLRIFQHCFR